MWTSKAETGPMDALDDADPEVVPVAKTSDIMIM